MECTILRASGNQIEVFFSDDIQPYLEKKLVWQVESPPGNPIPNDPTYDPKTRTATLKLPVRLINGNWVRFRLIEDRELAVFNPVQIIVQVATSVEGDAGGARTPE